MNQAAIIHRPTSDYIYPSSRNTLELQLITARADADEVELWYWMRYETDPAKIRRQRLHVSLQDALHDYYRTTVCTGQIAAYTRYCFHLKAGTDELWLGANGLQDTEPNMNGNFFEFLWPNPTDGFSAPAWRSRQVYYQIFPERFKNGDPSRTPPSAEDWGSAPTRENFMGGDLAGIAQQLDYIQLLGATCLYLTPIFRAPSNHKYDTADYFEIDPAFGTKDDLRRLVDGVHARGMRLYTMSNAAGLTWDFGVIPYEPAPFQWARRYRALMDAHERYGLCGTVDAHHFGWWPSVICEMAKWSLWEPETPLEELAAQLARRDYGAAAAPSVLDCWRKWSEAMTFYIPTDEDQYGPFRIGPSYPLILQVSKLGSKNLKLPQSKFALTGNGIFYTLYQPFEFAHQTPGFCRTDTELRSLEKMRALWESGTDTLEQAMPEIPERKREEGERLLNLGRFMLCCIRTAVHVKRWYLLNMRLRNAPEPEKAAAICEELIGLGRAELANTREAIPLVMVDSRLGWEPSMEYTTDRAHLEWKLEQLRRVVEEELPELIEKLRETTDM